MSTQEISLHHCIAGGSPAGMMLGFLLARAGAKWRVFSHQVRPSELWLTSSIGRRLFRPANSKVGLCSFSWNERDDNLRVEDVRNTAQERQRVALVARLFDCRDRLLAAPHFFR